jgi:hypothetical protein
VNAHDDDDDNAQARGMRDAVVALDCAREQPSSHVDARWLLRDRFERGGRRYVVIVESVPALSRED